MTTYCVSCDRFGVDAILPPVKAEMLPGAGRRRELATDAVETPARPVRRKRASATRCPAASPILVLKGGID